MSIRLGKLVVLASLMVIAGSGALQAQTRAIAIFAGGCFWCMEPPFDKVDGVISTTSGYTGGTRVDPSYEEVSSGRTHPARVTYQRLLEVFWRNIDPLDANGQFCDKGGQYRSAIFAAGDNQRALAEASKAALDKSGTLPGRIVTEILPKATFYAAEAEHQDYYRKNPVRYAFYRWNCGRDRRLEQLWGTPPAH